MGKQWKTKIQVNCRLYPELFCLCVFVYLPCSGLWCFGPVGQNSREEEYVYRDAILDGTGGYRLRREPWRHVRLQGASTTSCPLKMYVCCVLFDDPEYLCIVPLSLQSDLWSLGITAIEMAEGAPRMYPVNNPHLCHCTHHSLVLLQEITVNRSQILFQSRRMQLIFSHDFNEGQGTISIHYLFPRGTCTQSLWWL